MQPKRLAWILLPAAIVLIAVVGIVVSSYQKEAHIASPGKGARAAVAATAEARNAASGTGADGYDAFSKSLLFALVEARNLPATNPAETRLQTALGKTLDCLVASREAWQAELEQDWDPLVEGRAEYWTTLHPALSEPDGAPLSAERVREWSANAADHWLQKALDLVSE